MSSIGCGKALRFAEAIHRSDVVLVGVVSSAWIEVKTDVTLLVSRQLFGIRLQLSADNALRGQVSLIST